MGSQAPLVEAVPQYPNGTDTPWWKWFTSTLSGCGSTTPLVDMGSFPLRGSGCGFTSIGGSGCGFNSTKG
jgi:hypothetical protein